MFAAPPPRLALHSTDAPCRTACPSCLACRACQTQEGSCEPPHSRISCFKLTPTSSFFAPTQLCCDPLCCLILYKYLPPADPRCVLRSSHLHALPSGAPPPCPLAVAPATAVPLPVTVFLKLSESDMTRSSCKFGLTTGQARGQRRWLQAVHLRQPLVLPVHAHSLGVSHLALSPLKSQAVASMRPALSDVAAARQPLLNEGDALAHGRASRHGVSQRIVCRLVPPQQRDHVEHRPPHLGVGFGLQEWNQEEMAIREQRVCFKGSRRGQRRA